MNTPIRIQIDDATKRKADLWDGLEMLSSDELLMIDQALTHYAQSRHLEATERQREQYAAKVRNELDKVRELGAEISALRTKASRLTDLQDKITKVESIFYLPEEA